MNNYRIYWNNACDTLNTIVKLEDKSPEKLEMERNLECINERIQDLINNRRNINLDERFEFSEELSHVRLNKQYIENDYYRFLKFVNSPYFAKVTTDSNNNYFISSHMEDIKNNIFHFTSPIAKLRYLDVGESIEQDGVKYTLTEKENLKVKNKQLLLLKHEDSDSNFTYDGNNLIEEGKSNPLSIEVIRESLDKKNICKEESNYEEKRYTLSDISEKMTEEQDLVMRIPYEGILLIKGHAGSGKTNIAFHRIIYLINQFPEKFNQKNISVFCFNVALKKYLSNLLNEINIPLVEVNSIDEWIRKKIMEISNVSGIVYYEDIKIKKVKSRKEVVDIITEFLRNKKKEIISDLTSDPYLSKFNKFFRDYENRDVFSYQDIINLRHYAKSEIYKDINIIDKLDYENYIDNKLKSILNNYCFVNFDWNDTKISFDHERILSEFNCFNKYQEYLKSNLIFTNNSQFGSIISSDAYILITIMIMLLKEYEKNYFGSYGHIVIDEVQDFTPIQILFINKLHNNSMTLAGDIKQKIFDQGVDGWDEFGLEINNSYELSICHRSTLETMLFANQIVNKNSYDNPSNLYVGKRDKKPYLYICKDLNDEISKVTALINKIRLKDDSSSIVVVYPQKKILGDILKKLNNNGITSYYASKDNWQFNENVAVTTYQQIKGLEFDYVFIMGLNEFELQNISSKDKILYTCITRSQKRVFMTCTEDIPNLLKGIDTIFYEMWLS